MHGDIAGTLITILTPDHDHALVGRSTSVDVRPRSETTTIAGGRRGHGRRLVVRIDGEFGNIRRESMASGRIAFVHVDGRRRRSPGRRPGSNVVRGLEGPGERKGLRGPSVRIDGPVRFGSVGVVPTGSVQARGGWCRRRSTMRARQARKMVMIDGGDGMAVGCNVAIGNIPTVHIDGGLFRLGRRWSHGGLSGSRARVGTDAIAVRMKGESRPKVTGIVVRCWVHLGGHTAGPAWVQGRDAR